MKKIPEFLTTDQLERLVKHMCTPMMREAATVMYSYALRISELCNLERCHINLEHDSIRITGKGKVRDLAITDGTREILINAMRRPGKLFNVNVRTFRNYVYTAASRAELGAVHPHMIRHSRATHLLDLNVPLPDIQAWMRHDCSASTLIYTHVAIGRMRTVINDADRRLVATLK